MRLLVSYESTLGTEISEVIGARRSELKTNVWYVFLDDMYYESEYINAIAPEFVDEIAELKILKTKRGKKSNG